MTMYPYTPRVTNQVYPQPVQQSGYYMRGPSTLLTPGTINVAANHTAAAHTSFPNSHLYTSFQNGAAPMLVPGPSLHRGVANTTSSHQVPSSFLTGGMPSTYIPSSLPIYNSPSSSVLLSNGRGVLPHSNTSYCPSHFNYINSATPCHSEEAVHSTHPSTIHNHSVTESLAETLKKKDLSRSSSFSDSNEETIHSKLRTERKQTKERLRNSGETYDSFSPRPKEESNKSIPQVSSISSNVMGSKTLSRNAVTEVMKPLLVKTNEVNLKDTPYPIPSTGLSSTHSPEKEDISLYKSNESLTFSPKTQLVKQTAPSQRDTKDITLATFRKDDQDYRKCTNKVSKNQSTVSITTTETESDETHKLSQQNKFFQEQATPLELTSSQCLYSSGLETHESPVNFLDPPPVQSSTMLRVKISPLESGVTNLSPQSPYFVALADCDKNLTETNTGTPTSCTKQASNFSTVEVEGTSSANDFLNANHPATRTSQNGGKKSVKKRRIESNSCDSPTKGSRRINSPLKKRFMATPTSDVEKSLPSVNFNATFTKETYLDTSSISNLSFLSNCVNDFVTNGEICDPLGFEKTGTKSETTLPSPLYNLSSLVKKICCRHEERKQDLNDLHNFLQMENDKSYQTVSEESDQPPPESMVHSDYQLACLVELSEREMRLLTVQQECFRILKNISLCCQSWANHEGSYLWHVSFLLGATCIGDIASYSMIFEDIIHDIILRLREAEDKSFLQNSSDTLPSTNENNLEATSTSHDSKVIPVSNSMPSSPLEQISTCSKRPISQELPDLCGPLLTSLVHQVDSTTMLQCLVLLDSLRQHNDQNFTPLQSLQETLSSFVALQALNAVHQSPLSFLTGICKRFRSAAELGGTRSGKKRTNAVTGNVSASTSISMMSLAQKIKGNARPKKQLTCNSVGAIHLTATKPTPVCNSTNYLNYSRPSDADACPKGAGPIVTSPERASNSHHVDMLPSSHTDSREQPSVQMASPTTDRVWTSHTIISKNSDEEPRSAPNGYAPLHEENNNENEWEDSDEKSNFQNDPNTSKHSNTARVYSENNVSTNANTEEKNLTATSVSQNDVKGKSLDLKQPSSDTVAPMSSNNNSNGKTSTPVSCPTNQTFTAAQQVCTDTFELPRDPEAFRSQVKGVYYDDTSNRWCASWHERKTGKKKSRYFAVKKFGFSTAKTHAMDARLEAEESGECAPTNII
ncbi:uncharacterized protein LOC128882909 [Hylaeus volcanicus]|uniref:uncharacterized protein LOC128882909 n=1 Tax=Hylaeus volcanicus TaxID=313075 RepID=UPI0023B7EC0F|nr:uncharacterized protein LOC128882909 [Hylaeus volcanicus]